MFVKNAVSLCFFYRHAGFFTSEEVVNLTRTKLIILQVLYQKQFERLSYLFKEKRRHYLQSLRKEKKTLC